MADFWHWCAVFNFESYWLWSYRRPIFLRLLNLFFPLNIPYASHPSLPRVHLLCSIGLCLVGGGGLLTSQCTHFKSLPFYTHLELCGSPFGILHAVIIFKHDVALNIQSLHIRVYIQNNLRVLEIILCISHL